MEPAKPQTLRCAIYTRKSSEEGLEQDFNSLHAQRESCEAFVRSQTGEGWRLLNTHSTTAVFRARPWIALAYRTCLRASGKSSSMWWSSTRSTG